MDMDISEVQLQYFAIISKLFQEADRSESRKAKPLKTHNLSEFEKKLQDLQPLGKQSWGPCCFCRAHRSSVAGSLGCTDAPLTYGLAETLYWMDIPLSKVHLMNILHSWNYFLEMLEKCVNYIEKNMLSCDLPKLHNIKSLWPTDAIWQHSSWSTLAQVMACCPTAPNHYLNHSVRSIDIHLRTISGHAITSNH